MTVLTATSAFEATLGSDVLTRDETLFSCLAGTRPVPTPEFMPPPAVQNPFVNDNRFAPIVDESTNPMPATDLITAFGATTNQIPGQEQVTASATGDNANVLLEIQRAAASTVGTAAAMSSKTELATMLEGLARILRDDPAYTSISFASHASEIGQLKALLLKAQETIITLLNDRVFDRAKLSRLEAEARFFPDVQAQAHRASNLTSQTAQLQAELIEVKAEVERLRVAYVRTATPETSWFQRLFSRTGA